MLHDQLAGGLVLSVERVQRHKASVQVQRARTVRALDAGKTVFIRADLWLYRVANGTRQTATTRNNG